MPNPVTQLRVECHLTCHAAHPLVIQHVEQPRCFKGVALRKTCQQTVCGWRVVDELNTPGGFIPAARRYVCVCQVDAQSLMVQGHQAFEAKACCLWWGIPQEPGQQTHFVTLSAASLRADCIDTPRHP